MRGLADLAVDDVHIHHEQPARIDRADDGIDHLFARRPGAGVHGFLHHVGPAVVDALELGGVQRGLEVVVGPDVVHLAAARDDAAGRCRAQGGRHGRRTDGSSLPGDRPDGSTPPPSRPTLPVARPMFSRLPMAR